MSKLPTPPYGIGAEGEFFVRYVADPNAMEPGEFAWGSYDSEEGVSAIVGRSQNQQRYVAFIFEKEKGWDKARVDQWLAEHPSYLPTFQLREGRITGSLTSGKVEVSKPKIKGKRKVMHMPPRKNGWLARWLDRKEARERQREAKEQRLAKRREMERKVREANVRMHKETGGKAGYPPSIDISLYPPAIGFPGFPIKTEQPKRKRVGREAKYPW